MKSALASFSSIASFFDPILKKRVNRWMLLLPALNMCHWFLKGGGCTMCGFNNAKSSKAAYAWLTKYFGSASLYLLYWLGYWAVKNSRPENLTIYNGGSFLNDGAMIARSKPEIPFGLQKTICRHVGQHPTIQKLLVESRPEFVQRCNIERLVQLLNGKTLQVAIGFETVNDTIRNDTIRKGMSRGEFERAVSTLRSCGAQSMAYVFLKPAGLNDEQAAEEAIQTIQHCFNVGVDEVSLSSAFIQPGTCMARLFSLGEFTPPRLWTIIDVIQKTAHLGPVRIGSFKDDPPPIATPENCPKCTNRILSIIERYRQTHDITLFDGLTCECKQTA